MTLFVRLSAFIGALHVFAIDHDLGALDQLAVGALHIALDCGDLCPSTARKEQETESKRNQSSCLRHGRKPSPAVKIFNSQHTTPVSVLPRKCGWFRQFRLYPTGR